MDPNIAYLSTLMRETLANPRGGMRKVLDLGLPPGVGFQALMLVAMLSAVLSEISVLLSPEAGGSLLMGMGGGPFQMAILQLLMLGLIVMGIDRIGRVMGGHGFLPGAVLVVVWFQVIMIALQLLQIVILLLMPPLAMVIGFASIALFFWLLTNFIAELHGFKSLGKVFGVLLLSFFGLAFVLAFILTFLGLAPPMEV